MNIVLTRPSAAPVIQALRSIGYNASTAIADLVDNSLDAKASTIKVNFTYNDTDGMITINDNGLGMTEYMLQIAMSIGSKDPRERRRTNELGRFGMGLKTASFSLGKRLSVLTKKDGVYFERCWDLDHVSECNEWQLFTKIPEEIKLQLDDIKGENGTIVCIDKLDRFMGVGRKRKLKETSFYNKVSRINRHLEFVFHSILEKKEVSLFINGKEIDPWDPFMRSHPNTLEGEMQILKINDNRIKVQYFILPHASHLTESEYKKAGGYKGWRDHQGLYIYRENRLLYFGDWMGLFPKDAASQLARVRIDLPNSADSDWQVDIKKSGINLPEDAKRRLETISSIARKVSRDIFYFRTQSGPRNPSIKGSLNTWEQSGNEDGPQFILNRNHPILSELLKNLDDEHAKLLNLYLKFVQLGSPSNIIDAPKVPEEELQKVSDSKKELVVQFASSMMQLNVAENEEQLLNILLTQPAFDELNRATLKVILLEANLNVSN
ncbi:ATP-binding protein [Bacillus altitudinis]|uniref:ATP-binding protein n=1 Tax=Bacillus TaxID=1386 RepID=UPI000260A69A|nr:MULTISPECIES: ATP-binding protein [Bacillus]OQP21742.1 ATP-binding protein [Bacillus stratosphericus]ATP95984.1 ATP-binding protein [Bacillus altitudinis]EIL83525.1 ATP-binding protein [Bacillus sp. M 2-6]KAJ0071208.1 ATP-binding protein [Bacillus altitudinis]KDE28008.1 ATP-binding protein [Bacillus altitudinis 41KF2b]